MQIPNTSVEVFSFPFTLRIYDTLMLDYSVACMIVQKLLEHSNSLVIVAGSFYATVRQSTPILQEQKINHQPTKGKG